MNFKNTKLDDVYLYYTVSCDLLLNGYQPVADIFVTPRFDKKKSKNKNDLYVTFWYS